MCQEILPLKCPLWLKKAHPFELFILMLFVAAGREDLSKASVYLPDLNVVKLSNFSFLTLPVAAVLSVWLIAQCFPYTLRGINTRASSDT